MTTVGGGSPRIVVGCDSRFDELSRTNAVPSLMQKLSVSSIYDLLQTGQRFIGVLNDLYATEEERNFNSCIFI